MKYSLLYTTQCHWYTLTACSFFCLFCVITVRNIQSKAIQIFVGSHLLGLMLACGTQDKILIDAFLKSAKSDLSNGISFVVGS